MFSCQVDVSFSQWDVHGRVVSVDTVVVNRFVSEQVSSLKRVVDSRMEKSQGML